MCESEIQESREYKLYGNSLYRVKWLRRTVHGEKEEGKDVLLDNYTKYKDQKKINSKWESDKTKCQLNGK